MKSHWSTVLRRGAILTATAALLFTTSACGSSDDGKSAGKASTKDSQATFPRTVDHAMGRTEIPAKPKRVVALDMTFVDASLALQAEVVGFTTLAGSGDKLPSYFGDDARTYAPDARPVGTLSEPGLEKIAALKPDLILSAKVRHEKLYKQLSAIAPTVFSENTGAGWQGNLELVGRSLGREDLARERLAAFTTRARAIGDNVRRVQGKNPEVSVVRFVDGPTRVYKEDTYIGVVVNALGFAKPAAATGTGFNTEISDEEIKKMDADDIFISTYADKDGLSKQTKEKFAANPLWKQLKGTVHEVNDTTWMSAVGLYGANSVLDDIARIYRVHDARK
ncbi:ABC transporter substrate-binding protein [Embleya sp. NPDC001921]